MNNGKTDPESSIERLLRDALSAHGASGASDRCLDAETLAAWADQALSQRERSAAEAHAAGCARCQAMLAAMIKTAPVPVAAPWWRVHFVGWMIPVGAAVVALIAWSIPSVRPGVGTTDPAGTVASVERPAPPPVSARAEPTAPVPPAARTTPPETKEKEQSLREAASTTAPLKKVAPSQAELRRADAAASAMTSANTARLESAAARAKPDAAEESRTRAFAETVAVAPPPTPAPAPPPPAPQPAPAPAAAPAPAPSTAVDESARAQAALAQRSLAEASRAAAPRSAAADRLAARAETVAPATTVVSPNPLSRWRLLPNGVVERTSDGGATWQRQQTGVTSMLTGGASPSPLVCWVVGPRGLVLLTIDGRSWKRVALPDPIDLVSVRATDDKIATVVAIDGRSFETTDGGLTWRPR